MRHLYDACLSHCEIQVVAHHFVDWPSLSKSVKMEGLQKAAVLGNQKVLGVAVVTALKNPLRLVSTEYKATVTTMRM